MKKLEFLFVVASVAMLTSCGGGKSIKLSPEVEEKISEVEEIMGSTAGNIVRLSAECKLLDDSLTHNEFEEEAFDELQQLFEDTKDALYENAEKLVEELSGKTIPTVLADGVPMRLIKPFTAREGHNSDQVEFVCEVELTQDRPDLSNKYFVGSYHDYVPYVIPIDDSGQELTSEEKCLRDPFMNKSIYAPAGSRHELKFSFGTSYIDDSFLQTMTAKELKIYWNYPLGKP